MRRVILISTVILVTFFTLVRMVNAQVPHLINFQGNLTDKNGVPLSGTFDITFRIYNSDTGGDLLWEETQGSVSVDNGIFSIALGKTDFNPVTRTGGVGIDFKEDYWLSVEVDNDGEMVPRQQITSVGYAYQADNATNSDTVDGIHANTVATPGQLLALDVDGKLHTDITGDAGTVDGHNADDFITSETDPTVTPSVKDGVSWSEVTGIPPDIADGDQVGVTDHGVLTGLGDDDHTQYLNVTRHAQIDTNLGEESPEDTERGEPTKNEIKAWGQLDDGNPAEEAPTATERGEPTGIEIRQWADDITAWGHSNVVTNLNADTVDNLHASAAPTANRLYPLDGSTKFTEGVIPSLTSIWPGTVNSTRFTGTNWTDLTDGGQTTLHGHPGGGGLNGQSVVGTTNISTTLAMADMPNMSITFTSEGNPTLVMFSAQFLYYLGTGQVAINIDGIEKVRTAFSDNHNVAHESTASLIWLETLSVGSHTVKVQWASLTGETIYQSGSSYKRVLIVN